MEARGLDQHDQDRDGAIARSEHLAIRAPNDRVRDNVFWSTDGKPGFKFSGGFRLGSRNAICDPQLVDPPRDFRLRSGSPAAGRGAL